MTVHVWIGNGSVKLSVTEVRIMTDQIKTTEAGIHAGKYDPGAERQLC